MSYRFCIFFLWLIPGIQTLSGQIDHWTTVRIGDLECRFPKAYTDIEYPGASGVQYQGGNIYLTVTSLPDTSSMKGSLDRDYTRDFMEVVLATSRRINGRVREFRDTVIGNMPGYISRQEVRFNDGKKAYYDLLQLLHRDSLRGFSAQYMVQDAQAAKDAQTFFQSIRFAPQKPASRGFAQFGIWIGVALVVLIGITALLRLRSR